MVHCQNVTRELKTLIVPYNTSIDGIGSILIAISDNKLKKIFFLLQKSAEHHSSISCGADSDKVQVLLKIR